MYLAQTNDQGQWQAGKFLPFGNLSLSPAAGVLNYGQGVFEGLKAHRQENGNIVIFRPETSARRFAQGATRLCMADVPVQQFVDVLVELVALNHEYVPPCGLGSLYLRPCLWGSSSVLGVRASPQTTFAAYACPVGNYFGKEVKPVRMWVNPDYHYTAPKGLGHIKFIGNYAGTVLQIQRAKEKGFDGNIFLDAREENYVDETGAAHLFCIKGKTLYTPPLGSILTGVTRDSILTLARDYLGLEVVEERISIKDFLSSDECFCSGTAAVITPIGSITYQDKETIFNQSNAGLYTQKLYDRLTSIHQGRVEDSYGWLQPVAVSELV
jgi:branched-chain amino acid aminotransferase